MTGFTFSVKFNEIATKVQVSCRIDSRLEYAESCGKVESIDKRITSFIYFFTYPGQVLSGSYNISNVGS